MAAMFFQPRSSLPFVIFSSYIESLNCLCISELFFNNIFVQTRLCVNFFNDLELDKWLILRDKSSNVCEVLPWFSNSWDIWFLRLSFHSIFLNYPTKNFSKGKYSAQKSEFFSCFWFCPLRAESSAESLVSCIIHVSGVIAVGNPGVMGSLSTINLTYF